LAALPQLAGQGLNGPAVIFLGPQFRAHARSALIAHERADSIAHSGR
jgi:hypothetical protein